MQDWSFGLLKRLGFTLIPEGQDEARFRVHIPSWRLDVEREIDLIEEIARLHGYDKFENTLPAYSGAVVELPNAKIDETLRTRTLALGYNEALSLTSSLTTTRRSFVHDREFAGKSFGAGESVKRRSIRNAHLTRAGHAQHARVELESRCGQRTAVRDRQRVLDEQRRAYRA